MHNFKIEFLMSVVTRIQAFSSHVTHQVLVQIKLVKKQINIKKFGVQLSELELAIKSTMRH